MRLKIDTAAVIAEVQENARRMLACPRHRFPDRTEFGKPWVCEVCLGHMPITAALAYCHGYRAAGGDAREIWTPYQAAIEARTAPEQT